MNEAVDLGRDRWNIRWAAEISSRYHRRRATWLNNVDFVLNIVQMVSATAAFVELSRGVPGRIAAVGTLTVALCALVQIVGRLGKAAIDHELIMKGWCDLLTEIDTSKLDAKSVGEWMRRKGELDKAHVGELRALAVAAENETASALGVSGRQRRIHLVQWWLMHLMTVQRVFPIAPDVYPPTPDQAA